MYSTKCPRYVTKYAKTVYEYVNEYLTNNKFLLQWLIRSSLANVNRSPVNRCTDSSKESRV